MGEELTSNPTVRKLSFTGSTRVEEMLIGQCARTVKKVSLELGGNTPFIVFDDADLEAAVDGAVAPLAKAMAMRWAEQRRELGPEAEQATNNWVSFPASSSDDGEAFRVVMSRTLRRRERGTDRFSSPVSQRRPAWRSSSSSRGL